MLLSCATWRAIFALKGINYKYFYYCSFLAQLSFEKPYKPQSFHQVIFVILFSTQMMVSLGASKIAHEVIKSWFQWIPITGMDFNPPTLLSSINQINHPNFVEA